MTKITGSEKHMEEENQKENRDELPHTPKSSSKKSVKKLGSEKHKKEESQKRKRDEMPNKPKSSSKESVKKLGSEKHKEEESRKRKRDKMPNSPKSSSKESVKKLGSEKHKEEESQKRKRDKMPNSPKSSSKKSVKKLGAEKHTEEERRKRKRDKMPNTPKSSSKKSDSEPSSCKSPERAKIIPSLQEKNEKRSSEAQNELKGKSESRGEVTASAEKYTPSTRQVKIMRELGLMAPFGSPFCKRKHAAAPPKSPIITKGSVSAPKSKSSPSKPKERLPAFTRVVVCGIPAAGSADHVMK